MANCPVCGKKIAFMEGYSFFNQAICFDCHKLTDTDFLSSLNSQAIKEKIEGIDSKLSRTGISEKTRSDLLHVRKILEEAFDEQVLVERERHEADENIKDFYVGTLSERPGYSLKKAIGLVYMNPRSEEIAMGSYDEWMADCIKHISKKAYNMGANAILDLHILQQGSYFDSCLFYGTAVYMEKDKVTIQSPLHEHTSQ